MADSRQAIPHALKVAHEALIDALHLEPETRGRAKGFKPKHRISNPAELCAAIERFVGEFCRLPGCEAELIRRAKLAEPGCEAEHEQEARRVEADGCYFLWHVYAAKQPGAQGRSHAARMLIDDRAIGRDHIGAAHLPSIHAAAESLMAFVRERPAAGQEAPEWQVEKRRIERWWQRVLDDFVAGKLTPDQFTRAKESFADKRQAWAEKHGFTAIAMPPGWEGPAHAMPIETIADVRNYVREHLRIVSLLEGRGGVANPGIAARNARSCLARLYAEDPSQFITPPPLDQAADSDFSRRGEERRELERLLVWLTGVVEPARKVVETVEKKKAQRKRGRPSDTDAKRDAQIWDAWQTHQHKTYEDLATALKVRKRDVALAVGRHRKRLKRSKPRGTKSR
jgi:hypothetical protein